MDFQEIEVLGISIEKDQITKEIHSSIWHLYEVLRISSWAENFDNEKEFVYIQVNYMLPIQD